ncbi:MAG: VWA domain-containing protein, partial [Oscillospiraceae bacterium]|nr:VWA domain-containing protein [Oscillospiraceae bacterium]
MPRNISKKLLSLATALALLIGIAAFGAPNAALADVGDLGVTEPIPTDQVLEVGVGNDELAAVPNTDGKLYISKQAEQVKDSQGNNVENTFDITLTVQTQENIKTIYKEPDSTVVLVLDYSASLQSGATTVRDAAITFIDQFSTTSTETIREIAVVKFGQNAVSTGVWYDATTSNGVMDAKSAVSIINPADSYGTNYEAALTLTKNLFNAKKSSDENNYNTAKKYVVFLT